VGFDGRKQLGDDGACAEREPLTQISAITVRFPLARKASLAQVRRLQAEVCYSKPSYKRPPEVGTTKHLLTQPWGLLLESERGGANNWLLRVGGFDRNPQLVHAGADALEREASAYFDSFVVFFDGARFY